MSWSSARRILCVRLDTLGDVLMTTPALRALKEGHPQRRLTLLTSSPGAVVGRLVPEVDDVWTYDAPWLKASPARRDASLDRGVVDRLRAGCFDAAVVFTVYSQNPLPAALLTYLADIPLRLAHCRENPYQLLTHWVPETEPERGVRHEVTRQLDLAAAVGLRPSHDRLSLQPCPEDHLAAEAELCRLRLGRRWAVVHPGATASSRRYSPAGFAVVARALVRDHGVDLVFTGAADEVSLVEQIRGAAGVPTHTLAGRLSLGALAAVIGRAGLLISNNTGPAHVAAAMGTPVVDLYALTNPQHTPWAVPARVLNHPVPCAPCYRSICPEGHHLCLRGVPPAAVVAAALELLRPAPLRNAPSPPDEAPTSGLAMS